jgi:hypothetical protein
MSEHTKTPWQANWWERNKRTRLGDWSITNGAQQIAIVPNCSQSNPRAAANAAFIVRAANNHDALVAALEKSLAAINEQIHAETNRGNERIEQRAADLISEARQIGRTALAGAKKE